IVDRKNGERDAGGVRRRRTLRREFVDEAPDEESLRAVDALRERDFGDRRADERAYSHQAAMEYRPGAARNPNISCRERFERDDGRVGQIPEFVRQEPEAFAAASGLPVASGLHAFAPVLDDRTSDGIVEATIQRPKVSCGDR